MKCIIIDDEPLAREGMQNLVAAQPNLQLQESFNSAESAARFLENNVVDLIFLDIQMPNENGLDFAKAVPQNTLVIFTTAFPQYALESYEVDAVDYLVKPISPERLSRAVQRAEQYWKMLQVSKDSFESVDSDHIVVRSDRKNVKIMFDDILFIAGLKDYVIIHTAAKKFITWMNLRTIHGKLPKRKFLRASKSYIVNKDLIYTFDSNTVYIQDQEIPIGKAFQAEFFAAFNEK